MDRVKEVVTHAAVKTTCGKIIHGRDHASCFMKGKALGFEMGRLGIDQGFATNKRTFVDREIAANIAYRAGQIDKKTNLLFSENFWSDVYYGKYDYDEELGYVLKPNSKRNENEQ